MLGITDLISTHTKMEQTWHVVILILLSYQTGFYKCIPHNDGEYNDRIEMNVSQADNLSITISWQSIEFISTRLYCLDYPGTVLVVVSDLQAPGTSPITTVDVDWVEMECRSDTSITEVLQSRVEVFCIHGIPYQRSLGLNSLWVSVSLLQTG